MKKVTTGVSQESIDLFLDDLLLFLTQCFLSNCADGSNLYSTENNIG